jgi:hypothetical protein
MGFEGGYKKVERGYKGVPMMMMMMLMMIIDLFGQLGLWTA